MLSTHSASSTGSSMPCRVLLSVGQGLTVNPRLAWGLWPLNCSWLRFINARPPPPKPSCDLHGLHDLAGNTCLCLLLRTLVPTLEMATGWSLNLYPLLSVILFHTIFSFCCLLSFWGFLKNHVPYLIPRFQFHQVWLKPALLFRSSDVAVFSCRRVCSTLLPLLLTSSLSATSSPSSQGPPGCLSWGHRQLLAFAETAFSFQMHL